MENHAKHVLLIEDNAGDADLVRLRLVEGKTPCEVNCVGRLSDGLATLSKEVPTVILLDLNLPDSHGAETFRRVLEKAPGVPIVVLSGQDDEMLAIKAVNQGVQDYLVKGDITAKHLERAIRYAVERQALLRTLDITRKQQLEFKNQFLSHVSHELRTPLTCIHQYVTLLADGLAGPVAPEQSDHLKTILKSVNQLHAMIRDLLEATRAESGKLRVEQRCIAIGDLVKQAVAMMQLSAQEKRVGLEVGLDQRIPLVHADPDRVLEVLINLIDNAIKFTPPDGAVTVKACLVETDPSMVYVSVTDTGRGIAPEAKALIFERLYQDPEGVDSNRSGLGLGLFICKELIRLHQGRVWVSSEPGHGSTFTFTLPIYSLARLLQPVVTHHDQLRPAFILLRVDLKPNANPPRGNWRETWQKCLDILQRCVYLDKDLVLPPLGSPGPSETFFVVASTDLNHAGIMTMRIREQVERMTDLKAKGTLTITTVPIEFALAAPEETLPQQVQRVADSVNAMIMKIVGQESARRESDLHPSSNR
ncbi:MAG TPA: hybrid sensor histidine kinase/response regulator [Candidatus Sulfotelmatobacter sp.]|nr:hybrid sensor histidine kinase/response regulator [Candidatus Sulfotelmatobacter sp.]